MTGVNLLFVFGVMQQIGFERSPGIAYKVSGKTGIQIELKTGKSVMIGTRQPDELEKVQVKLDKKA